MLCTVTTVQPTPLLCTPSVSQNRTNVLSAAAQLLLLIYRRSAQCMSIKCILCEHNALDRHTLAELLPIFPHFFYKPNIQLSQTKKDTERMICLAPTHSSCIFIFQSHHPKTFTTFTIEWQMFHSPYSYLILTVPPQLRFPVLQIPEQLHSLCLPLSPFLKFPNHLIA